MARWMSSILLCLALVATSTHAGWKTALTELDDIGKIAQKSAELKLPIMLVFSAEWCEFCEVLDEKVFTPMVKNRLYDEKVVLLRHVGVDLQDPITLWDGRTMKKSQWAYEIDADLTPTVLFVDAYGKEIAPRIVGIQTLDLYATVIHQNINTAYRNMGLDKQIPSTPRALELQKQN
ncbi:thioredoxin family protein [Thiomicrorhabdus sediminis]|uniref:Thioredoxin-like n=1 Tax=Thiomicrorhabdus sediminis TaxID=2580412 RepID=A0A4P9K2Y6_9GAMM|nr:thioredoxin family protein [Thiomicrorhabdus sediminis]QCU89214.1 hypothetical protein FE785_00510 [Thiomicrorhabdus sediminis]